MKTANKKHKKTTDSILNKQIAFHKEKNYRDSFPIVAIGASAGGLEAMELFFTQIPAKTGMAYIVITHLDRNHASMMTDLLKKYTSMPILTIVDGMQVLPNIIYVIPPRKNVVIRNAALHLEEQTEPHYTNLPINFFLSSLALEKAENAAAVILSGAGTDGTLGASDIKLQGGIVIAQNPQSAKFDSMPISIINNGLADFVLLAQEMPNQLIRWSQYKKAKEQKNTLELQKIFTLIRAQTGYDFSSYKLNTISRCIEKKMHLHHAKTLSDYVMMLRQTPKEIDSLFKSLLIGVTRFFRDADAFDAFKKNIFPELFKNKPQDYGIRVWVPGCSTGEEVYSIAITLVEYMEEAGQHYCVQIFGTDIDQDSLAIARSGIYSNTITADVSTVRLKQYFTKEKDRYKIKKEIRSMAIFGQQNLIKDPPFTRVDIISCRNLLIYLDVKLQKKIFHIFHYSLKPKGILFLGMSESIAGTTDLFKPINNKKGKFFERKHTLDIKNNHLSFPDIPQHIRVDLNTLKEKNLINENSDVYIALTKYLFEKLVSPCILISKNGDIVYWHGNIKPYVKFSLLKKNSNIFDVLHQNVKNTLTSAIQIAIAKNKEVILKNIFVKHENTSRNTTFRVASLSDGKLLDEMLLILFEESPSADNENSILSKKYRNSNKADTTITTLKNELRYTKENLQAIIEELESSNEELQSMNEEMQSTNEELETSKEELHSLNEELVIMNTELQNRIDQLATIHDDMTNLFNSTDIATFFLDNNLCIKRYTPKALDFIHLISSDVGRPISHFATNMKYEKLTEDAEEVLRTLRQKTIEVQSKLDRWYLIRILPYRTLTNMIDGVTITFIDITGHKEAEEKYGQLNKALQNSLTCSKNIIDTVMIPLLVLTPDLKILSANRAVYKNFNLLPEDIIGKYVYAINGWGKIKEFLEQEFPNNILFEGFEMEIDSPRNGNVKISLNARRIFNELGTDIILVAMELK